MGTEIAMRKRDKTNIKNKMRNIKQEWLDGKR